MMALEDVSAQNKDARIAELTAEVARLREALNAIDVMACADRSHPVISTIARNALREG